MNLDLTALFAQGEQEESRAPQGKTLQAFRELSPMEKAKAICDTYEVGIKKSAKDISAIMQGIKAKEDTRKLLYQALKALSYLWQTEDFANSAKLEIEQAYGITL